MNIHTIQFFKANRVLSKTLTTLWIDSSFSMVFLDYTRVYYKGNHADLLNFEENRLRDLGVYLRSHFIIGAMTFNS